MKSICFYFQVHQPNRLRHYRFFDIGNNHDYFDDAQNAWLCRRVADKCYLPTNKLMLDLINENKGRFKISYSITGVVLEQFEKYTPEVIESFKALASTGCVEFIGETYYHSLAALKSKSEFKNQVKLHSDKIFELFGQRPSVFRNTELIYSDYIGEIVGDLGFKAQITEGAKHILGWRSPNFLYKSSKNENLVLLLKNFQLSDDIAFRFSQHSWEGFPLTVDKYVKWLNQTQDAECINLFMDYETFGEHQWKETGIFEFLRELPKGVFKKTDFGFSTPSQLVDNLKPVSEIHVPYPISWADEERDLTAWLGNDLQDDAYDQLYELEEEIISSGDKDLINDWRYLQTSDHFYYMCTKWFSDGDVHKYFNHYDSPYDAYINYMNVLSDFRIRLSNLISKNP
ncbi:MAG: glycoside hydrolase family 57 protein [Bacteroidales bacterium]|jgi:alpha-amylase|nr:glycoside hydrolase family 57 protein [Bacteroidales bacterium]